MNFVNTLLLNKEKYPNIITDEAIVFCQNIFGSNEFHFVVEDAKFEKVGESLVINAKTNVGSIHMSINPNPEYLSQGISLLFQDYNRGNLMYSTIKGKDKDIVHAYTAIKTDEGYYRAWNSENYFTYTYCSQESANLLQQKYGDRWGTEMIMQEEIPYERNDIKMTDVKQQIEATKDLYLYDNIIISRLKADQSRGNR